MEEEEKGFIIKDRRSFDEKGELKGEKGEDQEKKRETSEGKKREDLKKEDIPRPQMPEVNFNSLIFSLSSSVLLHLGEIADPQTGEKHQDLILAKHSIDVIAMLKEKTKGNLNEEEQRFLESILADLRWRFVKATQ